MGDIQSGVFERRYTVGLRGFGRKGQNCRPGKGQAPPPPLGWTDLDGERHEVVRGDSHGRLVVRV